MIKVFRGKGVSLEHSTIVCWCVGRRIVIYIAPHSGVGPRNERSCVWVCLHMSVTHDDNALT